MHNLSNSAIIKKKNRNTRLFVKSIILVSGTYHCPQRVRCRYIIELKKKKSISGKLKKKKKRFFVDYTESYN